MVSQMFAFQNGFQTRAATDGGTAKREKGWNDGGAVKNPLASVSAKDDNWRKQQIKAPAPAPEAVAGEEGANEE